VVGRDALMTTWGISLVKDEADIVEHTIVRMAAQVDRLLVADNGSTDGTREILERLARELPLIVSDDRDPAYYQGRKISALAALAAQNGAAWVVPFDADERWYSPHGRIADVLAEQPACVATAALYDHVATGRDPGEADPLRRMGWRRRDPAPLPKVACRPRPEVAIHQGNHGCDYGGEVGGLLVVRHYPYRSAEQMIRKARNGAAAYAATDLPEDIGAHWRQYGRLTDEQLADVFRTHFWHPEPERDPSLIYDPTP
jgi:glycosyltransferase involved in cell wall biosynthesis